MEEQHEIATNAEVRRKPVYDPTGRVEHINADETKIADVRRHLFGLIALYTQVIVGLLLALGLIGFLLPGFLDTLGISTGTGASIFGLISILLVFFAAVFLVLAHRIYTANQLIITDKNITQVLQMGLFHRKISELSMSSIEDVTAHQRGLFQTVFNYGTLTIETAGEQRNFNFAYCPNPNAHAKILLDARAAFLATNAGE